MRSYFWVGFGGALGSMLRFWLTGLVAQSTGGGISVGTLVVNVTGSFIIGLFAGMIDTQGGWLVSPTVRQFVMVGICGGYTTFSAFSLQTLTLLQNGDWLRASANTIGSVVLCLLAVWLGYFPVAAMNRG